jgi:hypothetical protein
MCAQSGDAVAAAISPSKSISFRAFLKAQRAIGVGDTTVTS